MCPRFSSQGICFPRAIPALLLFVRPQGTAVPKGNSLAWRPLPWGILISIQKEKGTAEFLLACSKNFVASAGTAGVRILVRIQKLNRWTGNGEIQHGSAGDTHTNNQECGSPEGSSQDLPCAAGTARQAESPALPCASSPGCPS